MTLPTPSHPTFNDVLPSGNEFTFRPFYVSEQKSILIAAQGGNTKSTLENLIKLVNECTYGKIDFLNLPITEFEKALLCIRSKSVGEVIEINYRCLHTNEEGIVCRHTNSQDVHFMEETVFTESESPIIDIDSSIKMKLKPLLLKDMLNVNENAEDLDFIYSNVEFISDGDEFFTEFSKEEFYEFMSKISSEANDKIVSFFLNFPHAILDVKTRCKKCGTIGRVEVEGAINFFA